MVARVVAPDGRTSVVPFFLLTFFLAGLLATGWVQSGEEEIIYEDNFESHTVGSSPPSDASKNWTIVGAGAWYTANGSVSDVQNRTGGGAKSLYSSGGGAGQGIGCWNRPGWGPVTNGRAEVWFYDDMAPIKRQFIAVDNVAGNNWMAIMVRTSTSATKYCYATQSMNRNNTRVTTIDRALGWHKVEWVRDTVNTTMHLDGVQVYSVPNSQFSDFNDFDLGSWSWDNVANNTGMWFDDAKVVRGQHQSRYRWYQNNSAENPTPLAAENTAITAAGGTVYRLRLQIQNDRSNAWAGSHVGLRYRPGTTGAWTDVSASGDWNYADGLGANGNQVANALLAGTNVRQHFVESEPSAASLSVPNGQFAEWDFTVTPTAAAQPGVAYQLKVVFTDSAGNFLGDLAAYPGLVQASITSTNLKTWNGSQGTNWSTANNWTPNGAPVATSDVLIPSGVRRQPTLNQNSTIARLSLMSGMTLTLGNNNALTVNGKVRIEGVLDHRNNRSLTINGSAIEVAGTYTHSGSQNLIAPTAALILERGGQYTQSGTGDVSVANLNIAGTYTQSNAGAMVNTTNMTIAPGGQYGNSSATATSQVNINGVFTNNGSMSASTGGNFRFSGATGGIAGSSTTTRFWRMELLSGTTAITATGSPAVWVLGDAVLTSGSLSVAGKTIKIGGNWTNNGGTLTGAGSAIRFAENATTSAACNVDNGTAATTFQNLEVAKTVAVNVTASRALNIGGSFRLLNGNLGTFVPGAYVHTLGGDMTVETGTLQAGTGRWVFNGPADAVIGGAGGTLGLYNVTVNKDSAATSVTLNRALSLGAALTMTRGTLACTQPLTLGGNVAYDGADTATISGQLALGAAARTFTVADGAGAVDLNVSAVVSGARALTKQGPGTMAFASGATQTYTGATNVNAGSLLVHGTLDTQSAGATVTADGAGTVLGGSGTINRPVVARNGARIAPGASVGTLTVQSADVSNGGIVAVEIPSSAGADVLAVNGTLTTGGTSELQMDFTGWTGTGTRNGVVTYGASAGGGFAAATPTTWGGQTVYVRYESTAIPAGRVNIGVGIVPTPVTLVYFKARSEDMGVLLEWGCASEFENLGFRLYRRQLGCRNWTSVQEQLIPGRGTNPQGRRYLFFDLVPEGVYDYLLETESVRGQREQFALRSEPVVVASWCKDWPGCIWRPSEAAPEGLRALLERLQQLAVQERGPQLSLKVKEVLDLWRTESGQALSGTAKGVLRRSLLAAIKAQDTPSKPMTAAKPVAKPVLPAQPEPVRPPLRPAFTAVKVVTQGRGVVWIPRAMLPAEYDPMRVAILWEDRDRRALAANAEGLALFAPGYEDDYTDRDAFFLEQSERRTRRGSEQRAAGLFDLPGPAVTLHTAKWSQDYHEVYYQWSNSLAPYAYPPWFSSKFLDVNTLHEFPAALNEVGDGSGRLTVTLFSMADLPNVAVPYHALEVLVNGIPIGVEEWTEAGLMMERTFTVPAGTLLNGSNTIQLRTPQGVTRLSFLHTLELEYQQRLRATGPVEIRAAEGAPLQLYEVGGLPSGEAWVVQAAVSQHPSRPDPEAVLIPYEARQMDDATWTVRFEGKGGRFFIVPKGRELAPVSVSLRSVSALDPTVTYLAVGQEQFRAPATPLLEARAGSGLRCAFSLQEDLFDAYGFGRYGPRGIQQAVRALRPRFVALLGRTTFDYRKYQGPGFDPMCPAFMTSTTLFGQVPADALYGDLGRGYPELAVGRILAANPDELTQAVNRILRYQPGAGSSFRAVLLADRPEPAGDNFCAQAEMVAAATPELAWKKIMLGVTHPAVAEARAALLAEVNSEANLVCFVGHGSAARIGKEGIFSTTTAPGDWKGNAVLLLASCNGIFFGANLDNYRTLPHLLLTQPPGGVPAAIGSPGYVHSGPHTEFMAELIKQAQAGGITWGEALVKTQQWAHGQTWRHPHFGDMARTEGLQGDPALPVSAPAADVNPPGEEDPEF